MAISAQRRNVLSGPNILIVRFGMIGDSVMTAHAVTSLRRAHPSAMIVWAIESTSAPVVDTARLVNVREVLPREKWRKAPFSLATWRDQLRAHLAIRRFSFDLAIDFQGHTKTAIFMRMARVKRRVAILARDPVARLFGKPVVTEPLHGHIVERDAMGLKTLGDYPIVDHPIMPELREEGLWVAQQLDATRPLVTIAVGSKYPNKAYPVEKWQQVAQAMLKRGCQVVSLGAPGEPAIGIDGVVEWVGATSLTQSMAAIRASAVHLAADTGTGHIAAAYDRPVVSIFGPTPPEAFRPWTDRCIVLKEGPRPEDVRAEQVIDAANLLLEGTI